jgi:predicted metal-dependent HD superfamily phosphohydrolase
MQEGNSGNDEIMNQITVELLQETEQYVTRLLENQLPDTMTFHNLDHARYVVDNAVFIGKQSNLSEADLNLLKICAWFHDAGYIRGTEYHEEESARLATEFLSSKKVDVKIIAQVSKTIKSTTIPQNPEDLISQVLCDADLRHLAEDGYIELIDNLRLEWINLSGKKIGKRKFHKISVKFFKKHQYHTDFARKILQPGKEKNLTYIKKKIIMLEEKKHSRTEQKKEKPKGYSRGVESMFRLTARNQINLSAIADNKSNILISVNAIMMSITMTVLVTRFEEVPNIILPTLIFLVSCLVTIIFAILSTRPNISHGTFNKEDIANNKVNLLFFGNFYNMKIDEYEWAIEELMRNDKNLYGTMIKDQFALGEVLAKKYILLRKAYNVFMVGIIISVIAFVLAFINI